MRCVGGGTEAPHDQMSGVMKTKEKIECMLSPETSTQQFSCHSKLKRKSRAVVKLRISLTT
jgi:hypothetical protein